MSHLSQKWTIQPHDQHTVGINGDSIIHLNDSVQFNGGTQLNGFAPEDSSDSSSFERIPLIDKLKSTSHPCFNHRQSKPQQRPRRKWTIQQKLNKV